MAAAAAMSLPWPEAAVIEEPSLERQIEATMRELPQRPLVLGGCCCAHVGAVRALARRHGRVAVVWIDAHGDLNTPESSPSGNEWGMPLRMLIEAGDVLPGDVTLIGARSLDPPEEAFVAAAGVRRELGDLQDNVYVALDLDAGRAGGGRRLHAGAGRPLPRRARTPSRLDPCSRGRRVQRPASLRLETRRPSCGWRTASDSEPLERL